MTEDSYQVKPEFLDGIDFSRMEIGSIREYLSKTTALSKRYNKLEIEPAVEGWRLFTQIGVYTDSSEILDMKVKNGNIKSGGKEISIETLVEETIFKRGEDDTTSDKPYFKVTSIFHKIEGIMPEVSEEVINEASAYLKKDQTNRLLFLDEVYNQIVLGKDGNYAERLESVKGEIAPVLYYFADKLREFKQKEEAEAIEAKIQIRLYKLIEGNKHHTHVQKLEETLTIIKDALEGCSWLYASLEEEIKKVQPLDK